MLESEHDNGKISIDRRYFIAGSGLRTVEPFAHAGRAHWGIEAMHWLFDVTFREDLCRINKGHVARNFSALRKFALPALRNNQRHLERSLRLRRNTPTATRRVEHLLSGSEAGLDFMIYM